MDHITASIDPSAVVFASMAILTTIAISTRILRSSQRRGRPKR
ncbi:hypothetical protein ABTX24_16495 [Nocardioides sp. NPDC127514]